VLFKVILPAALPSVMNTLRVNIAGAWNFLVFAELIAAQTGLGFRIIQSQRYLNTDKVLFCIIVIGLIGLLTDFIFKRLTLAITPWAEHNKA
jgi:NitT/TauT family transport system permease protein